MSDKLTKEQFLAFVRSYIAENPDVIPCVAEIASQTAVNKVLTEHCQEYLKQKKAEGGKELH